MAEDNSRVLPKITVGPIDAIPPFTVNKTTDVTYTATDIAGNAAKCKFRIVVEGVCVRSLYTKITVSVG